MLERIKRSAIYRNVRRYIKYSLRYGNLSANVNSARYWDAKLSRYGRSWRDENYYHLLEVFPPQKPFTLMDVGCALGDGCELLQDSFPMASITGVDISYVGIQKAQARNSQVDYLVLDILNDEIPDVYDYITIVETLEHFDDPFFVVEKCQKHVRDLLIISVPYTKDTSGPRSGVGEHRYCFNENTFADYDVAFAEITDYVEATKSKCIIYGISPRY